MYNHNRQRLTALEDIIGRLYDRLEFWEKELAIVPPGSDRAFELKQRIKRGVSPNIRIYEQEY